jgi:hypothetical protein
VRTVSSLVEDLSVRTPARHLTLDVDPGSSPLSGSLRDDAGDMRRFVGWMELVSVLQALLEPTAQNQGAADGTSV